MMARILTWSLFLWVPTFRSSSAGRPASGPGVSSLDLWPTTLPAVGLKPPVDRSFEGMDLFWSSGETGGWRAVRSGNWKLMCERGTASLFDLAADPSETRDQAASHPLRVQQLAALRANWLQEMEPPAKGGTKRLEPGQRPAVQRRMA